MSALPREAAEVLDFWFREVSPQHWFVGGRGLDDFVTERFANLVQRARSGELDDWAQSPRGRLALVVVLDQFSRHIIKGGHHDFDIKGSELERLIHDCIIRPSPLSVAPTRSLSLIQVGGADIGSR